MPRWGWEGQLGWGEESTYGTAATINRFAEHASGEVELGDAAERRPLIRGDRARVLSQTFQGRRRVSYQCAFDFYYKSMMVWFKHAIGSVSTTNPFAGVWLHTFNRADALPVGLTTEFEIAPDFYKLVGCRVNELVVECDAAGPPRVMASGPAKDYTIAGSGAAFAPPSGDLLAVFHQAALQIDAVGKQFRNFKIRIGNLVFADDFRSGARTIYTADPRDFVVDGRLILTAEEAAQLLKIRDFLTAALNVTFTGPVIAGGHSYTLSFDLPKVRYQPTRRRIEGPDGESLVELELEAYKDSAEALVVTIKNDQSAA